MSMVTRARLAEVMREPDPDLAEANLLISAEGRPDVNPATWLAEVDRLADLAGPDDADAVFRLLRSEGYAGDVETYDDPRNSFLDQVMRRRMGLPIALSALAIAIGRRTGASIRGIGMPGHYLVAAVDGASMRYVDPFHGWVERSVDQLADMLLNLEAAYRRRGRADDALWCCELLALIDADDPAPRVRVAELLVELGRPDEAEALLGSLLTTTPPSLAMTVAEAALADIRATRLN